VLFWALIAPKGKSLHSHLRFWVTPFDCDINLHCNNASYLKYMDLGRWDLILRLGIVGRMIKAKLSPAAVRIEIDYKKSLPPGTFMTLETHIESVGGKSFDIRQKFHVGDKVVADAKVTVVLIHNGRAVPAEQFMALLPESLIQKLPEHLRRPL
jgi:YbgC/YbaW family acyl-CoA thioester hydrolase